MHRLVTLITGFVLSMGASAQGFDRPVGLPHASRSEVIAAHGMAATSQPLATQVALDILKAGGSAVDAAIAANATLGLMEPTGCGIGGDLFAIVWDAEAGELTGLNASGRSPQSLTLQHFPRARPREHSLPRSADGQRTRRRGRLVRAAQALRPPADGEAAGARDRLRRGRLPGHRVHRSGLAAGYRRASRLPGQRRAVHAGRRCPKNGRHFQEPESRQYLPLDRERWPRRVLQGRNRRKDRCLHGRTGRISCRRRSRSAQLGMGDAAGDQLPRL